MAIAPRRILSVQVMALVPPTASNLGPATRLEATPDQRRRNRGRTAPIRNAPDQYQVPSARTKIGVKNRTKRVGEVVPLIILIPTADPKQVDKWRGWSTTSSRRVSATILSRNRGAPVQNTRAQPRRSAGRVGPEAGRRRVSRWFCPLVDRPPPSRETRLIPNPGWTARPDPSQATAFLKF